MNSHSPVNVHAIGADIQLFEIQQPIDITYRLYDWARRDSTGQLRDLHVEQALAVADLSAVAAETVAPTPLRAGELQLVRSEHFVMTQLEPARSEERREGKARIFPRVQSAL